MAYVFSDSVSLLRGLPEEKLGRVVDCLEVVSALAFMSCVVAADNVCSLISTCSFFHVYLCCGSCSSSSVQSSRTSLQDCFEKGEYIIREGEEGSTFFIISKGEVRFCTDLPNVASFTAHTFYKNHVKDHFEV